MCVLNQHPIPDLLFRKEDSDPEHLEMIAVLREHSLIIEDHARKTFEIDSSIRSMVMMLTEEAQETQKARDKALEVVWDNYPDADYENWDICELLDPHAQMVLGYSYDSVRFKLRQACLLSFVAAYAHSQGRLEDAEESIMMSLDIRASYPEAVETLWNLGYLELLGSVYSDQGRWTEAENIQRQVVEVNEDAYGPEDERTLRSKCALANMFLHKKDSKQAEELLVPLLEIAERQCGPTDSLTLTLMNDLAMTFNLEGRLAEAKTLTSQVLDTQKAVFGLEHPHTLTSMQNLASIYNREEDYEEAVKVHTSVLRIRERVLGIDHPETSISLNNLGWTLLASRNPVAAEDLLAEATERRAAKFGPEHPDTVGSMHNLALAYWNQGRHLEGMKLMQKVFELSVKVMGEEHPHTRMAEATLTAWHDSET